MFVALIKHDMCANFVPFSVYMYKCYYTYYCTLFLFSLRPKINYFLFVHAVCISKLNAKEILICLFDILSSNQMSDQNSAIYIPSLFTMGFLFDTDISILRCA